MKKKEASYNDIVKERLQKWLADLNSQGFELDYGKLAIRIQNDYNINTTAQKLRAMFAYNDRKIQLAELVALCHLLGIPLQNICEITNAPSLHFDLGTAPWIRKIRGVKSTENSKGISQLNDYYYSGSYYCYYFYPKHFVDSLEGTPIDQMDIEEAEVEINPKDGGLFVTMKEKTSLVDFWGKKTLDEILLQGRLYLVERTHEAYCFLTDNSGKRVVFLMFDYVEYSKDIMFYRTAAMLTISRNLQSAPLFQKIAMFRVKQDLSDPKTDTIIRGILALNTGKILVKDSVFDKIKASDPVLEKFNWPVEKYYVISESEILKHDAEDHQTFEDRRYRLMKIRRASEFQSHELVRDDEEHAIYMKKIQMKQREQLEKS